MLGAFLLKRKTGVSTMAREYWNEGQENESKVPARVGILKSLVTLLGLLLALTIYMLAGEQRSGVLVLLALGCGLIWLAYGFQPKSGSSR
jgi:hypothetical protein